MKEIGYGEGYKYSHDYDENFAPMENLPDSVKGHRYYYPANQGYEVQVRERLMKWWGERPNRRADEGRD